MSQNTQARRTAQANHADLSRCPAAAHQNARPEAEQPNHPTLPGSMTRGQLEGLLIDVSPALGMSGELLRSCLAMLRATRPSDWTDPGKAPVCYAMQGSMAASLGKTDRALRNDEGALISLGFIDKQVAANGSRCRLVFADGEEFRQGLCFSPLIARVPDLLALRAREQYARQHRMRLKRQCSALKRNVKMSLMALQPKFPDHAGLQEEAAVFLGWPTRYSSFTSLEALEAHYDEVLALSENIDEISQCLHNTSGRAEPDFRPYIQDTTQDNSVICNHPVDKSTGCKQPDTLPADTAPDGAVKKGLENKYGGAEAARNPEFTENLSPWRLFALSSEEMQLYISHHQGRRPLPSVMDFILASIDRLPDLGINRSAYEAAQEQMGDMACALCILIIDQNRFHPKTPVKNPGGVLRAMTARHQAGKLNITGSLIGLTERMGA